MKTQRNAVIILAMAAVITDCGRADELILDPRVQPLAFRAPGRVTLLPDGRFACVSRGVYHISDDDGMTWTPRITIPRGAGPVIDSGLLVADKGKGRVLVYRDDAGMHLERAPDNMPLPGARLQMWCVRSTDGGKTWQNPQRLIDGYCGAAIGGICLNDNRLVIPLQDLRYEPPRHVTVVFSSDDGGRSWYQSDDLDIGGHGIEDGSFEPTVAERQDRSLLMFLRTTRDAIWQTQSTDGGRSWTSPKPAGIAASNSPSFLLRLHSGRLALVWNPVNPTDGRDWPRRIKPRYAKQPDSVYREELLFALSDDDGATWTEPVVIAKQPGARLRYAYMLELQPGEIRLALRGAWYQLNEADFVRPQAVSARLE